MDATYHRVLNIRILHLPSSRDCQACEVITQDNLVQEYVVALCVERCIVLKIYTHLPSF